MTSAGRERAAAASPLPESDRGGRCRGSRGGSEDVCLRVRMRGLEPPRPKGHTDLNRARLPIPPHPRGRSQSSGASGVPEPVPASEPPPRRRGRTTAPSRRPRPSRARPGGASAVRAGRRVGRSRGRSVGTITDDERREDSDPARDRVSGRVRGARDRPRRRRPLRGAGDCAAIRRPHAASRSTSSSTRRSTSPGRTAASTSCGSTRKGRRNDRRDTLSYTEQDSGASSTGPTSCCS